jgi:integrase
MITKVRFWAIRKTNRPNRPKRFEVRWTVDNKQHSRSFPLKAQAESFRADLQVKARNGETFDPTTGLPQSQSRTTGYDLAQQMVSEKWAFSAAKSRVTEVDNLAHILCALIPPNRTAPAGLRLALRASLGKSNPRITPSERSHLNWLKRASMPVTTIDTATVRRVLQELSTKPGGGTYSHSVQRQRRVYFSGLMTYALEQELVTANPVKLVKGRISNQTQLTPAKNITDMATAQKVIDDLQDPVIRAFLATILYAGLRPSEAAALRVTDCELPSEGWGMLNLTKSASRTAAAWTDTGATRDDRGLKHRAPGVTRSVPIPPRLVENLAAVIGDRVGGHVFLNRKGRVHSDSTICRHWSRARSAHKLNDKIRRVYDLRHLCASTWIAAGIPITEIASRLGHSPEVCLRVYAHTIETHRDYYNQIIEQHLP